MRLLTGISVFLLIFWTPACLAQFEHEQHGKDSLRKWFPQKLGKAEWSPLFGFDSRWSWLSGKVVLIRGIRIGVTYKGIHHFGGGYYWMKRGVEYKNVKIDEPDAAPDPLVKFDTRYFAGFYERVVYRSKRWNVSIPLMFSFGSLHGYYETPDGQFPQFVDHPFSAMTTGIHARLYLMTWLVPRLHIGYRFTFNTTKEVKRAFDGIYFTWGLSVMPMEMIKRFKSQKAAGKSIFDPRPI